MSHLVLDASMALSWLLPDEANAAAVAVQAELAKAEGVWVGAHWCLEVANSLCRAERRKRLDAAGMAQAVALFTPPSNPSVSLPPSAPADEANDSEQSHRQGGDLVAGDGAENGWG